MKTQDLGLATALASLGHNITGIYSLGSTSYGNPKFEFEFEWKEGIEKDEQNYYARSLQVDALTYFTEMRSLKTRMYSELRQTN